MGCDGVKEVKVVHEVNGVKKAGTNSPSIVEGVAVGRGSNIRKGCMR